MGLFLPEHPYGTTAGSRILDPGDIGITPNSDPVNITWACSCREAQPQEKADDSSRSLRKRLLDSVNAHNPCCPWSEAF